MSVREVDAVVEELCGDLGTIRAPRGQTLNARSWQTEAPLRMLLNNLDREVAEKPEELIVYGGSGKAARNHDALKALVRSLLALGEDETLLVQSGKPVGVFRTHPGAPRVLIANSLLVPRWATWDEFRRLEALGLTMFGQMTAGSWIYIGTQGILQGTYQTFAAAGEKHFGSPDLSGKTILTAGLGGMGGAQPLAATMTGAAILCIEVDPHRIERRLETRYLDEAADSLEDALARVRAARDEGRAPKGKPLALGGVPDAAERVAHEVGEARADLVRPPEQALDVLHPFEVRHRDATRVREDVRQDRDPAFGEDLVPLEGGGPVGALGHKLRLEPARVRRRHLVLRRGQDEDVARELEELGVRDVLRPGEAGDPIVLHAPFV